MPDEIQREERSSFPIAFALGAAVVLFLVGGLILVDRFTRSKTPAGEVHLPFGAQEQAAAARIHFSDPQMARASNYLNQEVTYVGGVVSNDGVATIKDIEVTFEFHDQFDQVILRETRRLLAQNARPMGGGERRDFQVSFEYIPDQWTQQYPSVRVTGLLLLP
jgi:hypothetical protein